ncbi:hypothetical protein MHYP_G00198490 [Metynnis hypsauchen]
MWLSHRQRRIEELNAASCSRSVVYCIGLRRREARLASLSVFSTSSYLLYPTPLASHLPKSQLRTLGCEDAVLISRRRVLFEHAFTIHLKACREITVQLGGQGVKEKFTKGKQNKVVSHEGVKKDAH